MRRLPFLVGGIVFVDTMFFAALTPLLPDYADKYDLSKAGAGILAGAYPLGALVGGIPGGSPRPGSAERRTTIAGALLIAVNTMIFATANSIVVLDLARFAQGFGSAFAWTAGLTWLVGSTPAARGARRSGPRWRRRSSARSSGRCLAEWHRSSVAASRSARRPWSRWGSPSGRSSPPSRRRRSPSRSGSSFARCESRRIQLGVWFVVLPALFFGTLSVLAPLRLDELGFSAVAIGVLWLCTAALEATANPIVGRITDRVGRIGPMTVLALASAIATAGLPWPGRAAVLAVLVVAASMSFGSFWTPAMALLSDEAEARGLEYAYAFALINIAWAPGQAIGAVGGGALAELTSDTVPYLLLSGASLITFAVLWRFRSSS